VSITIDPFDALAPGWFVDSDHPDVRGFAESVVEGAVDERDRVRLLFAEVRDRLRYDPYSVTTNRSQYRASAILSGGPAWCVPKAVLLTAALRAVGIPAALGFSDVRNHLSSEQLVALMGTDLFIYHGWTAVWVNGRWSKGSPAFNSTLCRRFGVPALDFDGTNDALLHATDGSGRRHMEYVSERGTFLDLPFDDIMRALHDTYGPGLTQGQAREPAPVDPVFDPARRGDDVTKPD
jgi:transglutaminase-like putative cysteine protease